MNDADITMVRRLARPVSTMSKMPQTESDDEDGFAQARGFFYCEGGWCVAALGRVRLVMLLQACVPRAK